MNEVKHTPGPWIFYADLPSAEPNWHIVTPSNKMRVLANVHIEPGNEMDVANARLIAAAPDLLVAMIAARSFVENEVTLLLDSSCLLHPETLEPDRDTAEPEDLEDIEAVEAILAGIDAVLAKAGAQ